MGGPHKSTSFGLIALHSWMSSSSARISSSVTPSLSSTASIGEGWLKPNCQTARGRAHERGIQSIAGSRWCETARGASQGRPTRIQAMATACRLAGTYTWQPLRTPCAGWSDKTTPLAATPSGFSAAHHPDQTLQRGPKWPVMSTSAPCRGSAPCTTLATCRRRRWPRRGFSACWPELIDTVAVVVPNMPPHRTRATCTACAG